MPWTCLCGDGAVPRGCFQALRSGPRVSRLSGLPCCVLVLEDACVRVWGQWVTTGRQRRLARREAGDKGAGGLGPGSGLSPKKSCRGCGSTKGRQGCRTSSEAWTPRGLPGTPLSPPGCGPPALHRGAMLVPAAALTSGCPRDASGMSRERGSPGVPLSVLGVGGVSCPGPRPRDGHRAGTTNHLAGGHPITGPSPSPSPSAHFIFPPSTYHCVVF